MSSEAGALFMNFPAFLLGVGEVKTQFFANLLVTIVIVPTMKFCVLYVGICKKTGDKAMKIAKKVSKNIFLSHVDGLGIMKLH